MTSLCRRFVALNRRNELNNLRKDTRRRGVPLGPVVAGRSEINNNITTA